MKKIIISILVLLLFIPNIILGESSTITIDSVYDYSSFSLNDYEIYYDGDLTIDVTEDRTITGNNGIYVTGNLTITGTSNLTIDVSGIGIKVDGDFKVENPCVFITGLDHAYEGYELLDYAYVLDSDNNMAYWLSDTYYDYSFNSVLTSIIIKPRILANLDNIDDSHLLLYKNLDGDIKPYINVDGFLINTIGDEVNVTYNEDLLTYYVKIWNDFNEDNVSFNFIELLFKKNEWSKSLDYEVIEANNFYKDIDTLDPYVVKGDRIPMGYVGNDIYSYSKEVNSVDSVSTFMLFVAKGQNNKIVLKVYGEDGSYRYINLVVNKKKEEEKKHHDYTVVNTGAKESLPTTGGELSGDYIVDDSFATSSTYTVVGPTTIDLNGKTIKYNNNSASKALFDIKDDLTINGEKEGSGINAAKVNGTLFMMSEAKDVNIVGGTYANINEGCAITLMNIIKGNLTIDKAIINSINNKGIVFQGNELKISYSNINTKDVGVSISSATSTSMFKNIDITSDASPFTNIGTLTIESGKYNFDPTGYIDTDKYVIGINTGEDKYTVGYKVTFDADNGSETYTIYVIEDEKVNKPEDPEKEGYTFNYWKKNEVEYNFDSEVIESMTLKADYTKNEEPKPDPKPKKHDEYITVNTGVR